MRRAVFATLRFIVGVVLLAALLAAALMVGNLIWNVTQSEILSGLGFVISFCAFLYGADQVRF